MGEGFRAAGLIRRLQSCQGPATGGTAAALLSVSAQRVSAADDAYHAALTDHVPGFITAPGQTDYLFILVVVLLLVLVLVIGNLYFQLHAVPERIAHRANKGQMEIVAVLALISLFTHNHLYWILGLLLALVRIPDFSTPLYSIALSLRKLSGREPEAAGSAGAAVARSAAPPAPAGSTPVAGAPIAPVPAAIHPQPPRPASPHPAPHPPQPAAKPDPKGEGI